MSHKEDYVNIGLMLVSCGLAFILPFELFLFSYAVLGPLHYLTEISWLHQRDYFSTGKKDYWVLVLLCLFISAGVIFHDLVVMRSLFPGTFSTETIISILKTYTSWFPVLIFTAFVGSIGLVFFKKTYSKVILFGVGLLIGFLMIDSRFNLIWIGTFVPTLIHVYVFTGLFMLYGALKSGSKPGYVSVLIFIGCALSFYFIQYVPEGLAISNYIKDSVLRTGFSSVNKTAIGLFKSGSITQYDIFESKRGLMVQRFIAFAYTYHYLNWFSKTEIIKWHKVPARWLILSILIWIASISLYIYDFRTGLVALFFLSLLHVFLEFPLNFRSIMGIKEELKNRISSKKTIDYSSR
jgi:hypothetical protein